jgi:hypothetical protein
MAPARLAESIKRFEQQSMSQHVITAEVAAEKFKKSDIHTNRSENNGSTTAATAVNGADVDDEKKSAVVALKTELAASVGGDEARDDTNAGATASTAAADSPAGERAPKVSMGAIKSFADFEDDSVDDDNAAGTATLDDIDADDDAAALLDPDVDRAHFGRRSSGGVSRDYDDDDDTAAAADLVDSGATIEPYTPPRTPPPLSPSDETNGSFADADASMAPSRRSVNAQTALFGVNLDMDTARADGTLNCRGKLPLAVVRALTSKMSVVGRMELEKCDSYLAALSSSSSRDRALCYISASGADSSEKLAQIAQSLRERARVGVVKLAKSNPNLRECFLIPWNGTEPLPTFLTQFTTLLPQPADDAPLLVVLVLSKQPGAAGVAAGLLTSSDGAAHASAAAAPPPVAARVPTPAVTVPTAPTPVLFGGAVPPSQLSLALSSLAASLASGGGAALLAATRGAQALPPQQPALMQQPQQPQQPLPHQLHQQQLQQQQQMRQQHILMQQQQQQQQQHHRFGPPQHHQQPMMQQQRPGMPIDPRTGLPLQRGPGGQPPPPRGW